MFEYINRLLAMYPYEDYAWRHLPEYRHVLVVTERLLRELTKADLLPLNIQGKELVTWLLHHSPLTNSEIEVIRFFVFKMDYY